MVKVQDTIAKMRVVDRKFRYSCRQITLLNHRIKDKQVRFDRAHRINQRSLWYNLRLQLSTLEGVKNMFLEYAYKHADELEALQHTLLEVGNLSETEEDLYWDEED